MTVTRSVAEGLTCEEIHAGFDALIERLAEVAAERDCAFKMAAQATKDQLKTRTELDARLKIRDIQIDSLRAGIDGKNAEIRQLTARVRELALVNEDQQRQLDVAQRLETPALRRRFLNRLWRRLLNRLRSRTRPDQTTDKDRP